MKPMTLWALGAVGMAALVAAPACDSEDDGNGGGGTSATGTPTGTGGACSCYSCADFTVACINQCPPGDPREIVCSASLPMLNALNECICDPARAGCAEECPDTCAIGIGGGGAGQGGGGVGGRVDTPDCIPCQSEAITDVCKAAWDACAADRDCS